MNGKTIYEYYPAKSYITDALSKYTQKQLIEDLVPNVNYTCELATYSAASQKAFPIATAHFTTLVGSKWNPSAVLQCRYTGFNGNWSLVTFYKEKLGFMNNLTCVGHEFNFGFLPISILSFGRFGFLYYCCDWGGTISTCIELLTIYCISQHKAPDFTTGNTNTGCKHVQTS